MTWFSSALSQHTAASMSVMNIRGFTVTKDYRTTITLLICTGVRTYGVGNHFSWIDHPQKQNEEKTTRLTGTRPQIKTEQNFYRPLQDKNRAQPLEKRTQGEISPIQGNLALVVSVMWMFTPDVMLVLSPDWTAIHNRLLLYQTQHKATPPIRTDSSKELEYVSPNSLVDEQPRTKHHSKTDIIASSPKRCYPLHPTPPQSIQNDTFTPVLKNKAEQKKKTCRETNFMKRW